MAKANYSRRFFGTNDHFFYGILFVAIVTACLLHLYWYNREFYAISWDESARILDAHKWMSNKYFLNTTSWWLPFYRVVVGSGLEIYPDLFVTPRIISFIFGLGTLCAAGWLSHELFNDRWVTLLTVVIGTFFSQRIALSLAPLSSIMFTCIILISVAFLVRWNSSGSKIALLSSAIFFAISGTIRYEGWMFSGIFLGFIFVSILSGKSPLTWQDLGLLFIIIAAFPLLWMTPATIHTGNPIGFLNGGTTHYGSMNIVLWKNPLVEFVKKNTLSLNLLGLIPVVYFIKNDPRLRAVILIPSIALLAISGQLLLSQNAQSGPAWRMIGVWSMLLLPFTAYLIWSPEKLLPRYRFKHILTISLLVLILSGFTFHTYKLKKDSAWAFPMKERQVGQYLNDILTDDPHAKILIESSQFFYLNIIVASQHPDAFVLNSIPEKPWASDPILPLEEPVNEIKLADQDIKYLLFKTRPYRDLLDRKPNIEKIKSFGQWSVYRMES